jgi:hypothetical protein
MNEWEHNEGQLYIDYSGDEFAPQIAIIAIGWFEDHLETKLVGWFRRGDRHQSIDQRADEQVKELRKMIKDWDENWSIHKIYNKDFRHLKVRRVVGRGL